MHRLYCKEYYAILHLLLWAWGIYCCGPSKGGTELLSFLGSFLPELTDRYSTVLPCPQPGMASPWLFSCRQYLEQFGIQLFCWLWDPFEWKGDNQFLSSIAALCPVIQEGCTKPLSWKWELAQVLAALLGRIFRTKLGVKMVWMHSVCLYIWLWK